MRFIKTFAIIAVSVLVMVPVSLKSQGESGINFYINNEFVTEFTKMPPIMRDDFLDKKLNHTIHSRGIVKSLDFEKRYKKNFRLVLGDTDSEKMNVKFTYFIFFDNKEFIDLMTKDSTFEFSGQMMAYTPLNTMRDAYILDVILEKGSIVIDQ